MSMAKPRLVVFDLDYTLWPFWVDTHVTPPFRKTPSGDIVDRRNSTILPYPDTLRILEDLHSQGVSLGIASRTGCIREAQSLMKLFDWNRFMTHIQIFPDCKLRHFQNIHDESGIPFSEMLFFDDEYRNIRDVSGLGVTCVHAENGMSLSLLHQGLKKYSSAKSAS